LTPNELVLSFGGFHVCVNFGENRRRNATVRVLADGQIHRLTDRRKPIFSEREGNNMLSSVRLSVCLSSVTLVRPTQAIEIVGNVSTPCGTLVI